MWRPVKNFQLQQAVQVSVYPNPVNFPNIFWAGEAFSSYQAWIEGALETAQLAVETFYHSKTLSKLRKLDRNDIMITNLPVRDIKDNEMVIEGRIIGNLYEWAEVHPGSSAAITNHLKEDVTNIIHHIQHSDNAWATMAALQIGWLKT